MVAITGVAAYSSYELYNLKKNPGSVDQARIAAENQKTINAVSELMVLPDGTPQVGSVSQADIDSLKQTQPFFTKAEAGDQLLIFTEQAVIYRPSTDKIINVAPVNRQQDAQTPPATNDVDTTNPTDN